MTIATRPSKRISGRASRHGRPGLGHRLPEIAGEAPLVVGEPPPEDHLHREPHLAVGKLAVGEVGHETASLVELDHPVDARRVDGNGEEVAREGLDPGRSVGEFIVVLGVDMVAFRVHADVHLRVLGRPAVPAPPADEAGEHLALPPEDRHRRLGRGLRPDPHLGIDQVPEFQKLHVIVDALLVFQGALDAGAGGEFRDRLRDLEVEGVAPLAESGEEDPVAGLRLFEGRDEHQQRMGRPRLPAHLVHLVDFAPSPGRRPAAWRSPCAPP